MSEFHLVFSFCIDMKMLVRDFYLSVCLSIRPFVHPMIKTVLTSHCLIPVDRFVFNPDERSR